LTRRRASSLYNPCARSNGTANLFRDADTLSWLLRVPTFKEKAKAQPDNINYGLVGYPVLMTADIVLYKAEVIRFGEDQLPHIELAREIVRRSIPSSERLSRNNRQTD